MARAGCPGTDGGDRTLERVGNPPTRNIGVVMVGFRVKQSEIGAVSVFGLRAEIGKD